MRQLTVVLLLAGASCLSTASGVAKGGRFLTTELPPELNWCNGTGPEPLDGTSESTAPVSIDGRDFMACQRLIQYQLDDDFDQGSYWFRVTTNAEGHATSACLIRGTLGNHTEYLQCVVKTLREKSPQFAPSKTIEWRYTFIF